MIFDQMPPSAASLGQMQEQYAERARNADMAADLIRAIRATGRSRGGLATVTVDGSAVVVDVQFSDSAPASHAALGRSVKEAHDRAVSEWNRQVHAITEEHLATDDQLREHIQNVSDADFAAHTDPDNLGDDEDEPR